MGRIIWKSCHGINNPSGPDPIVLVSRKINLHLHEHWFDSQIKIPLFGRSNYATVPLLEPFDLSVRIQVKKDRELKSVGNYRKKWAMEHHYNQSDRQYLFSLLLVQ